MSPAQWFEVVLLVAIAVWLVRRKPRQDSGRVSRRVSTKPSALRKWRTREFWRWMAWWWTLAIALMFVALPAAAEGAQRAYTTANPASKDWLGLATQQGRYAILLGDGCDGIEQDMNVLADTSDENNWTLQLEDSDQLCAVVEWHWMGNTPCFTNADGECDIADA
jgi:hypothetical protein